MTARGAVRRVVGWTARGVSVASAYAAAALAQVTWAAAHVDDMCTRRSPAAGGAVHCGPDHATCGAVDESNAGRIRRRAAFNAQRGHVGDDGWAMPTVPYHADWQAWPSSPDDRRSNT